MAEKDYTKDSKKWPKTPGKDWQLAKKKQSKKGGKGTADQSAFNKHWG